MKPVLSFLILVVAVVVMTADRPQPAKVQASPAPPVIVDHSAELESFKTQLADLTAKCESLAADNEALRVAAATSVPLAVIAPGVAKPAAPSSAAFVAVTPRATTRSLPTPCASGFCQQPASVPQQYRPQTRRGIFGWRR